MLKNCEFCQTEFNPGDPRTRFCSISCGNKSRKKARFCKKCGVKLRVDQKGNVFCSHSCSAQRTRTQRIPTRYCLACDKKLISQKKYCNKQCSGVYRRRESDQKLLKNGTVGIHNHRILRRVMIAINGWVCGHCNLTEWNGKPIPLTIEHKDGDAYNNDMSNLELICWNCHAQTPTFGAKNKGHGRESRKKKREQDLNL